VCKQFVFDPPVDKKRIIRIGEWSGKEGFNEDWGTVVKIGIQKMRIGTGL
jgi:hypothetical protein